MSKYRIAPDGPTGFKIQSKWWGLFWVTMYQPIAPGYYEVLGFNTEDEAKAWIDKALDYERRNAEWHKAARERKRAVRPETYP
jgi:hypothetical protein